MKIKDNPEDFIVKENLKLNKGEGPYAYFLLRKKQWNTADAIREIADKLRIPEKNIGYAGLKDRQALTEQHISILHGKKEDENVEIKDVKLEYLGQGAERIHIGQLESNSFEIIVRKVGSYEPKSVMPNYFDEQRFGFENMNADIGKAIVKKDLKNACNILKLEVQENNYAGALQKQGKILSLYLHSYQSRLFNRILSGYIKKQYKHKEIDCGYEKLAFPTEGVNDRIKIPLINFDMEAKGELKDIVSEVLLQEGITQHDFLTRPFPELISKTEYRDGFAKIKGLEITDLGDDSKKAVFELQKGSYATVALKAIFLQNL